MAGLTDALLLPKVGGCGVRKPVAILFRTDPASLRWQRDPGHAGPGLLPGTSSRRRVRNTCNWPARAGPLPWRGGAVHPGRPGGAGVIT